jgi:hypothetical protein
MDALRVRDEFLRTSQKKTSLADPSAGPSKPSSLPPHPPGEQMPSNIKQCLDEAMTIEGAVAVALVDFRNGMTLGTAGGGGLNLEVAAAGNTEVVRAKMRVMERLGIKGTIEDILITLDAQFHIIRLMQSKPGVFLYLALAKDRGTLGMARLRLSDIEAKLQL